MERPRPSAHTPDTPNNKPIKKIRVRFPMEHHPNKTILNKNYGNVFLSYFVAFSGARVAPQRCPIPQRKAPQR